MQRLRLARMPSKPLGQPVVNSRRLLQPPFKRIGVNYLDVSKFMFCPSFTCPLLTRRPVSGCGKDIDVLVNFRPQLFGTLGIVLIGLVLHLLISAKLAPQFTGREVGTSSRRGGTVPAGRRSTLANADLKVGDAGRLREQTPHQLGENRLSFGSISPLIEFDCRNEFGTVADQRWRDARDAKYLIIHIYIILKPEARSTRR